MSGDNKLVIKGEASESDDEDINFKDELKQGLAVDGEAPESDEDIISYCKDFVGQNDKTVRSHKRYSECYRKQDSILQRKLIESNACLWRDLTHFIQNTVLSASKELLSADQHLLKSQISLQTASNSLKIANATSKQILDKTKDVMTANFIPFIKIS